MRFRLLFIAVTVRWLLVKFAALGVDQVEWGSGLVLRHKVLLGIIAKAELRGLRLLLVEQELIGVHAATLTLGEQTQSLLV